MPPSGEPEVFLMNDIQKFLPAKGSDGPPLPRLLELKWPEPVRRYMKEHWPGTPFSRSWGEAVVKRLPLGLGQGVLKVVDTLGL